MEHDSTRLAISCGKAVIRVLLRLAAILFFWAAGGAFILFGQDQHIPPLEGLTTYGCTSYSLLDGSVRANAWADYDDAHLEAVRKNHFSLETEQKFPHRGWVILLSHRFGKKADFQAARDCVEWKRAVEKLVNQKQKEQKE